MQTETRQQTIFRRIDVAQDRIGRLYTAGTIGADRYHELAARLDLANREAIAGDLDGLRAADENVTKVVARL